MSQCRTTPKFHHVLFLVSVFVLAAVIKTNASRNHKLDKKVTRLVAQETRQRRLDPTRSPICVPTFHHDPKCLYKTDESLTQICCSQKNIGNLLLIEEDQISSCKKIDGYLNGQRCDCGNNECRPNVGISGRKVAAIKPQRKTSARLPLTRPISTKKPPPAKELGTGVKCYSCNTTQTNRPGACKDNPATTAVHTCKVGEVCRTVTYVSFEKGGSVIIRGCHDPADTFVPSFRRQTNAADKKNQNTRTKEDKPTRVFTRKGETCTENPPNLPKSCNKNEPDCGHAPCSCTCNTNFCNKVVYIGQGWDACRY